MRKISLALFLFLTSIAEAAHPKLIVTIVFDQFRADYLMRFQSRFLPAKSPSGEVGGFQYLMTQGAYFPYGQYDILQSMTGPGHATILSGSYPYQMGIPANDWWSQETGDYMYCAEDQSIQTVGADEKNKHVGTSPKNLVGSTVGDELKNAGYPSKVVTVALKDRAAIFMGGHRPDIAVWMDQPSFQWVSSNYYLPDGKLPEWMVKLNHELDAVKGQTIAWNPAGQATGFSATDSMARTDAANAGKVGGLAFPHSAKAGSKGAYALPFGEELTETAAERAIDAYKIGRGKSTDLLAVSFSSHDYMGHAFGPNSREMEEMTVAEDRILSKLINYVRKNVGLSNVVFVMTGDHGIPPSAEYAKAHGNAAGYIDEEALTKKIDDVLNSKIGNLGGDRKWILFAHDLDFFLNRSAAIEKGYDLAQAQALAKSVLIQEPGAAHVITAAEVAERKLPPGMHERQILHTYYPGRSADLVMIPKPYFMPVAEDTVSHLTGYSYDRTVPIIFAGPQIKAGTYATRAEVIDIAPTLTFLSGVVPPNLSEGRVLNEILK